jgi:hypothetical protein
MRVLVRVDRAGCRCAQVEPIGAHHPNVTIQTSFLGARVPGPGRGVPGQRDLEGLGNCVMVCLAGSIRGRSRVGHPLRPRRDR